jgi:hypothetical protein
MGNDSKITNYIHNEIKGKFGPDMHATLQFIFLPVYYLKKLKIKIYKTMTLPGVLYSCGTWSLNLRGKIWIKGV